MTQIFPRLRYGESLRPSSHGEAGFSLRIEASCGVLDLIIVTFPWMVGHSPNCDRYSGRALLERRVQYEHVE